MPRCLVDIWHLPAQVVRPSGVVSVSAAAERVVIGDIGGTNARFQVWEVEDKTDPSSATMTFEKVSSRARVFQAACALFRDVGMPAKIRSDEQRAAQGSSSPAPSTDAVKLCTFSDLPHEEPRHVRGGDGHPAEGKT